MIKKDNINLRLIKDNVKDFKNIFEWCQNKEVYFYFEQRKLTYDEIVKKYKTKINNKIKVLIIEVDKIPIGVVQYYSFKDKEKFNLKFNDIYEIDIYIGNKNYYNKGIGTKTIELLSEYLFNTKRADCLVMRPMYKNKRAIKSYQKCGFNLMYTYFDEDTIGKKCKWAFMIKEK